MTTESAFWTKNLYRKIRAYFVVISLIAIVVVVFLLTTPPLIQYGSEAQLRLIYAVYLIVPVLIATDFLGYILRINRAMSALGLIETDLERLCEQESPELQEVMRLVAEYNCAMASGVPIPGWFFRMYHDEIQKIWDA